MILVLVQHLKIALCCSGSQGKAAFAKVELILSEKCSVPMQCLKSGSATIKPLS